MNREKILLTLFYYHHFFIKCESCTGELGMLKETFTKNI